MCGYFGNLHECPEVIDILNELGIPLPYPQGQYYQRRWVEGMLSCADDQYRFDRALWWFALRHDGQQWQVNEKITSFNARNLHSKLWRGAIRYQRGLVFATEIGESDGRKRYLMRSASGLALATLYRDWQGPDGVTVRSMAVITRPPHERFSRYHDKSIPCFLPLRADVIRHWLDPKVESSELIEQLLEPKIYQDLEVRPVKSYKNAEALGDIELLERD